MINDLDESLKELLIKKGGFNPSEVDVSFDTPTRDWSTPVTRPTVNLYLFDVRENLQLRDMQWDQEFGGNGRIQKKRRPRRMDLSYMVTCWTSAIEDQHRLLWHVLEILFRHSPLPNDVLKGSLVNLQYPIRTEVAQPDGVIKNPSEFWGALENQIRPSISLSATLELDLNQLAVEPITFAKIIKLGQARAYETTHTGHSRLKEQLAVDWESSPVRFGGRVRNTRGDPVANASLRLIGADASGRPRQVGPTVLTDENGLYRLTYAPPGDYTFVVEAPGQAPQQQPLTIAVRERGEPLPELVHEVEVPMA